jgi:3-hydroxyisobutyrate dehydrogenase
MTSGQPAKTRKIAAKLAKCGATMIDAPVSGGVPRAKTGDLAIMVGAEEA